MTVIAHITDVHLPKMPFPSPRELSSKQFLGFLNWHWFRKNIHKDEALTLLLDDLKGQQFDHLIVSGDIVNLALRGEIISAISFMNELEQIKKSDGPSGHDVSLVAGNHDYYAGGVSFQAGGPFSPYMTSDDIGASLGGGAGPDAPFVRLIDKVAVIGLNSAVPTPLFKAYGEVSPFQIEQLGKILEKAKRHGFYRCVTVHHPPLEGLTLPVRALKNADALTKVLQTSGAELVLYGHNHVNAYNRLKTEDGPCHVIGTPSASAAHADRYDLARYNLFKVSKIPSGWETQLLGRGLDPSHKRIVRAELRDL